MFSSLLGLEKDEYDRERKFYRERGLPCPKDQALEEEKEKDAEERETEDAKTPDANTNMDFHRFDEQVGIQLELKDDNDTKKNLALKRRFIRCSSIATVTHLKKFIAKNPQKGSKNCDAATGWDQCEFKMMDGATSFGFRGTRAGVRTRWMTRVLCLAREAP